MSEREKKWKLSLIEERKETWGGGNNNTKDVWFIVLRYSRHHLKKTWCWDPFLALSMSEWGYFYICLYKIFTSYTSDTERLLPRTRKELKRNKTTQTINRSMNWTEIKTVHCLHYESSIHLNMDPLNPPSHTHAHKSNWN